MVRQISDARFSNALQLLPREQSPERLEIENSLLEKRWFQLTDRKLQKELLSFPENHNGYLKDLASRSEEIANVRVNKLSKLAFGNFAIISVFEITNSINGRQSTYEYVSWRHGPRPGAKGLVLIKDGDTLTHFVVLHGEKFATALPESDLPGGFIESKDGEESNPMVARFKTELQEELGLENIELEGTLTDLGLVAVDPGMTNQRVQLYVAIINAALADRIDASRNKDSLELKMGAAVMPMDRLSSYLEKSEGAYFGQCVLRAVNRGIIPAEALVSRSSDQ